MFIAEFLFQRVFFLCAGKELVSPCILLIQQISRTSLHRVNSACPTPSREAGNRQTLRKCPYINRDIRKPDGWKMDMQK